MDWAQKIVDEFYGFDWCERSTDEDKAIFLATVRKAKADGLREAADFIAGGSFLHDKAPGKIWADQVCPKLNARASQIERGEI